MADPKYVDALHARLRTPYTPKQTAYYSVSPMEQRLFTGFFSNLPQRAWAKFRYNWLTVFGPAPALALYFWTFDYMDRGAHAEHRSHYI